MCVCIFYVNIICVSLQIACTLPCSGLTTYSAVLKIRESVDRALSVHGYASVLVVGAGGLGVWCIILIKALYK